MEAKEILNKYREQVVVHTEPIKRAVAPLERPIETPGGNVVWDDNMSVVKACEVFDINEKDLSERIRVKLIYIINEFKRLGAEKPEEKILKTLRRIGTPPLGQDPITHLSNYLKLRATSDKIGSEKSK